MKKTADIKIFVGLM